MPITFQIHPTLQLVETRITGDVSTADLRGYVEALLANPLYSADLQILGDISGVLPRFNSTDLVQYHEWRRSKPKFGKMTIIASTDHEYGIGRQFELATNAIGGSDLRVFRKREDARAWLGLSDAKAT